MFKDIVITCPACGKETTIGVSSPEPKLSSDQRLAVSTCRNCFTKILARTSPDGEVSIVEYYEEGKDSIPAIEINKSIETAFGISDVIKMPYALWQPRDSEVERFQLRPEWQEALEKSLKQAQVQPRPLSVPRRIFISYKWGKEEENAWVEDLYNELTRRGNIVVFDHHEMSVQPELTIPQLVARIANCHIFLAILDPGYIERVTSEEQERAEGWVTDEYHTALEFATHGVISLIGMLRKGDWIPPAFRIFAHGNSGNTFDVRQPDSLITVLDRFFVQYGQVPVAESQQQAMQALHQSRQSFNKGDLESALSLADEAVELIPDIADAYAQRARVAYNIGNEEAAERALNDASRAFKIDSTLDEMLIYAAAASCDLKKWSEAAAYSRLALERDLTQKNAHFLLGWSLSEMGQLEAAIAHLELSREMGLSLPRLYHVAAMTYLRYDQPQNGLELCRQGLQRFPNDEIMLSNACVAAMEADQAMLAYQYLHALSELAPDWPALSFLTQTLASWCQQDETPPPVIIERVEHIDPIAIVECSNCSAHISMTDENQLLCGGCGALLKPSVDPCRYCGSEGKIVPGLANFNCPFCREGSLHYVLKGS